VVRCSQPSQFRTSLAEYHVPSSVRIIRPPSASSHC